VTIQSLAQRQSIRVLVVDDEPAVRLSLRRALELEHYEVECVESGHAALDALRPGGIDLVILDVSMPELDGLDTCRQLRRRGDSVPVLMLTARNRMIDTVVGLDCGADDYLAKPFDLDVLYARLRSLIRRSTGTVAGIIELEDLTIDTRTQKVKRSGEPVAMTPKEYELVELLVARAGEVLHRDWIAEKLWESATATNQNSLDVFVASIRRKLESNGRSRLIHTVRGTGYVARPEPARIRS
jgi:two-component system, OmpR family, response regulator MprA